MQNQILKKIEVVPHPIKKTFHNYYKWSVLLIFPHCPSVFRKNLQKSLFKQVWGTRLVCAAKLSGVREFPKAGLKVITGCTKHPAFNSKYCQEHCTEESPAVTASSVSSRTRQQLRKYRTDTASYAEAEQDEVYIVESIMEIKSKEVLVKWVGFPNPTWENENGIPKFIRNYYEKNPGKLGKALPNPKIKHRGMPMWGYSSWWWTVWIRVDQPSVWNSHWLAQLPFWQDQAETDSLRRYVNRVRENCRSQPGRLLGFGFFVHYKFENIW